MPPASRERRRSRQGRGEAGLKFFDDLNAKGNFVPVIGKAAAIAQGTTPVIDRLGLQSPGLAGRLPGQPEVEDRRAVRSRCVAGVYIQAISAYAPHPNAAKLWMEYLYSDEGQLGWLEGLLPPDPLQRPGQGRQDPRGAAGQAAAGRNYAKAVFPTLEQQNAAKKVITKEWDTVVGANVQ